MGEVSSNGYGWKYRIKVLGDPKTSISYMSYDSILFKDRKEALEYYIKELNRATEAGDEIAYSEFTYRTPKEVSNESG